MKKKMAIILMVLAVLIGSISGVAGATSSENPTSPQKLRLIEATIDETIAGNVIIQANAEDDKGLTTVGYRIDSGESIPMTMVSGNNLSGTWEAEWDTTAVVDGVHSITVIATDSGDQPSEPYQVEVNVDNIDEPPQVTSVIILTPTPTPTPTSTPTATPTLTPTPTPPPPSEWIYEVTYPSQDTTYWKYIVAEQENISDIVMYDCDGVLMDSGSEPSWDPSKSYGGLSDKISVQAYTTVDCTTPVTMCTRIASGQTVGVLFPQLDWRGVDDQQLRLRRYCAYQSMLSPTDFTNLVYYRAYTAGFGAPYATNESWTFTRQIDSGGCLFSNCGIGDSTASVAATVASATEEVTVPAGTFTCYKITFDNGDQEWWDADGVFPYAPIKITSEDFDDTQTSVLYSQTVPPTPTPTPTATSTPSPTPTPTPMTWNSGDEWTWRVYYNSQEATPVTNTKNQSYTVDAVGVTTSVKPSQGATSIQVGPCYHTNTTFESDSIRRVDTQSIGGIVSATFLTQEVWFNESNLAPVELHNFTETTYGQAEGWEYLTHPDPTCWWPLSTGQSWDMHTYCTGECAGFTVDYECDLVAEVTGYIQDYDLSTCSTDVVGTGVYDVYHIEYFLASSSEPVIEDWFAPEVNNIVRRVDYNTFEGYEDRVLIDYSITE